MKRKVGLFIFLLAIIACNRTSNEELIIGKWQIVEYEVGSADTSISNIKAELSELNEYFKNLKKPLVFSFEKGKICRIYSGEEELEPNAKKTYSLFTEDGQESADGKIIKYVFYNVDGSIDERTNSMEHSKIITLTKDKLITKVIESERTNFIGVNTVYKLINKPEQKKKSKSKKGELTDDLAKETVEKLLLKGDELPDNRVNARLTEWHGLFKISENEMHAKAIIRQKHEMAGKFVFRKNVDNEWVLLKVEFRTESGMNYWKQEVFQKVE